MSIDLHDAPHRYSITKTYGHERGFSCVFRQWPADGTHCRYLHGYALSFSFTFKCRSVDDRNWVFSFGDCGPIKDALADMFDHTLVVAEDDPERPQIERLGQTGVAQIRVVPMTGCEAFARIAFDIADGVAMRATNGRARCVSCTVSEHPSNSATYTP